MNKKHFPDEYDDVTENVTSMLGSRFARLTDDEFLDRDLIRSRRGKFRSDGSEYGEARRNRSRSHDNKRTREKMH